MKEFITEIKIMLLYSLSSMQDEAGKSANKKKSDPILYRTYLIYNN